MDLYQVTPKAQKVARMVDRHDPRVLRTAAAVLPDPSVRADREVALRLLAVALYNYHHAVTSYEEIALKSANELTETERAFFERYAVPAAMQAIWNGR